jgi:hypothetical protein
MEARQAFHAITAALTTGMLALVFFAVLTMLFAGGRADRYRRLTTYADGAATLGASLGMLFLLAALVTGFAQWPWEAYLNSPIGKNKIFTALIALMFWAGFLWLRWKAGEQLWRNPRLVALSTFLALGGFAYIVFTNSIGGHIAGIPSGFERLVMEVGIETRRTFTLPAWASAVLILLGLAGIAWGVLGWPQRSRVQRSNR